MADSGEPMIPGERPRSRGRLVVLYAILVTLSLGGCLLVLGAAEFGYRVFLKRRIEARGPSYRVTPSMYVDYDEAHGERFKPDHEMWISYVENGRVVWGAVASRANADGLGGRTTLAEYDTSEVKILVFGDSFTHWRQGDVTWPDLLEQELRRRLGRRVAVLNFGRGAYGVIQMLELAAEQVPALRPDLVVIAAIGEDFSRARWWCREIPGDGYTRWILSEKKDGFGDYRYSVDELLIEPRATPGWCDSTWHAGGYDPLVESLNERYRKLAREVWAVRPPVELRTLRWSYLLGRLLHGDPLHGRRRTLPRVAFSDYRNDPGAMAAIRTLRATGVPILLAYLPVEAEVRSGKALMAPQALRLMRSLEREMGIRFEQLQSGTAGRISDPFDVRPFDRHPSLAALRFYAVQVADRCMAAHVPALNLAAGRAARPGSKVPGRAKAAATARSAVSR